MVRDDADVQEDLSALLRWAIAERHTAIGAAAQDQIEQRIVFAKSANTQLQLRLWRRARATWTESEAQYRCAASGRASDAVVATLRHKAASDREQAAAAWLAAMDTLPDGEALPSGGDMNINELKTSLQPNEATISFS